MRRSQSLRKAIYALAVLAIFMVVLRISRPTTVDPTTTASSAISQKEQTVVHHNTEAAAGQVDAPAVEKQQIQQKEEVNQNRVVAEQPKPKEKEERPIGIDTKYDNSEYNVTDAYENILHSPISPPVIIFSKTRCPHSKRVKSLLLEAYKIEPKPMVIELDIIFNGVELQRHIGEVTKRHTVPNIIVNGISRGGASEMIELGENLMTKFLEWGEGKFSINKRLPDIQQ